MFKNPFLNNIEEEFVNPAEAVGLSYWLIYEPPYIQLDHSGGISSISQVKFANNTGIAVSQGAKVNQPIHKPLPIMSARFNGVSQWLGYLNIPNLGNNFDFFIAFRLNNLTGTDRFDSVFANHSGAPAASNFQLRCGNLSSDYQIQFAPDLVISLGRKTLLPTVLRIRRQGTEIATYENNRITQKVTYANTIIWSDLLIGCNRGNTAFAAMDFYELIIYNRPLYWKGDLIMKYLMDKYNAI